VVNVALDSKSNETSGGAFQATNLIHKYISNILDPSEIFSLPSLNRFERAVDTFQRIKDDMFENMYRQGVYKQTILDRKLHSQGVDFVVFGNPLGNISQIRHTPYITTLWDFGYTDIGDLAEMRTSRYGGVARKLITKNLHAACAIIVESDELSRRVNHSFQIEKQRIFVVKFVPHESYLSYVIEDNSSKTVEEQYLLYPANFWSHKNHHILLQAMNIFREKNRLSPTKLVLTGIDSGNRNYVFEKAKAMDLSEHIVFRGFVEQQDLIHLYLGAKAILFPTMLGPTNIPPLEAMSLGRFVSVSKESSHELEDFSGFEVNNSYDPSSWAKYFDPEWHPPKVDAKTNREVFIKRNHENELICRKLLDFVAFRTKL
jgi:glycosyltransferase involved in cell wall biosynthesis